MQKIIVATGLLLLGVALFLWNPFSIDFNAPDIKIGLSFILLIGILVIFALEIFPIDFVAFGIIALILVLGPYLGVSSQAAISGFSNPATVTVLAMFILAGGIARTGVINWLAKRMIKLSGGNELLQLVLLILMVGPISAFINNTPVVAIMIPLVISMAREHKMAPSKLLIPLSYISQLAGVATLIGTSTNILASTLSEQSGFGPFGMFEFTPIGLMIFATGCIYLLFIGRRLLPTRPSQEIAERYEIKEYLTEVVVLPNSPLVGKTLIERKLSEEFDIQVLEIRRDGQRYRLPVRDQALEAGDVLLVRANQDQLLKIKDSEGLAIEPEIRLNHDEVKPAEAALLEVIISPNSDLIGGTLRSTNFRNRFGCTVIAMQKHGSLRRERLGDIRLEFGDTLLVQGDKSSLEHLQRSPHFIVTEEMKLETFRTSKIPVALAIVAGVVIVAALGWTSILVTAVVGCVLMVLTGCLSVNELHESIRWDVIFLLAGVIPLGIALQTTGGADLLAGLAASIATVLPPIFVLILFYLFAMILTALISNNATVVVLVPIAIATAQSLGLDPKALILAVMFAASNDFATPIGYQTNTMVYGPGGYKFMDYVRVGGPLNLILAFATPIFIYLFWGL